MYILVVLRQVHKQFSVVQTFTEVLESKLRVYHQHRVCSDHTHGEQTLLLWCHTVHCLAAVGSEVILDGQKGLQCLLEALGIVDLGGFVETLKDVAWVDGTLGDALSEVLNSTMATGKTVGTISCWFYGTIQ